MVTTRLIVGVCVCVCVADRRVSSTSIECTQTAVGLSRSSDGSIELRRCWRCDTLTCRWVCRCDAPPLTQVAGGGSQSLHRARRARQLYRHLFVSKHHAARVIQKAWHNDAPRRRARDEWLRELARRAAYRDRVRHAIDVTNRFCRMAPKVHYYRRLLKAALVVQVRHVHALGCVVGMHHGHRECVHCAAVCMEATAGATCRVPHEATRTLVRADVRIVPACHGGHEQHPPQANPNEAKVRPFPCAACRCLSHCGSRSMLAAAGQSQGGEGTHTGTSIGTGHHDSKRRKSGCSTSRRDWVSQSSVPRRPRTRRDRPTRTRSLVWRWLGPHCKYPTAATLTTVVMRRHRVPSLVSRSSRHCSHSQATVRARLEATARQALPVESLAVGVWSSAASRTASGWYQRIHSMAWCGFPHPTFLHLALYLAGIAKRCGMCLCHACGCFVHNHNA